MSDVASKVMTTWVLGNQRLHSWFNKWLSGASRAFYVSQSDVSPGSATSDHHY